MRFIFFKYFRFMIVGFFCGLCLTSTAAAIDHYVSTTGNFSWSESTDINKPCSATTAMQNAVAGDTVFFRGGTYELGQPPIENDFHNALQPSNSGTPGNVITFKNYPDETVTLNADSRYNAEDGTTLANVIGVYRQNYITIDGFKLTCDDGDAMASSFITYHQLGQFVVGNTIRNCDINGGYTPNGNGNSNPAAIRLEDTDGTVVENNTVYGYYGIDNNHNTSAIKYYHNKNVIFRNNEVFDSFVGMFDKSNGSNNTIENNYFHDVDQPILITDTLGNNDNITIKNNVIYGVEFGIYIQPNNPTNNLEISNNTIYRTAPSGENWGIVMYEGTGDNVYNNIIVGFDIQLFTFRDGADFDSIDHNLFPGGGDDFYLKLGRSGGYDYYKTLAAWQSSGYLDAAWDAGCGSSDNPGCGSLSKDPLFINASGAFNKLEDFNLSNSSPAKGAGRGGVDMGANISLVGVQNGDAGTLPVSPADFKND